MKTRKFKRGFTLVETITALLIFGTVMSTAVSFFVLSQGYYFNWAAEIDTLSGSQQAVRRLAADIAETDPNSIQFSAGRNAVVFISARSTSNGKFQTAPNGGGTCSSSAGGVPCWEKWVCYYLAPDPNGPYSLLIRKESQSLFGGLPSASGQTAPATWLNQFQGDVSDPEWTAASGVQTFDLEDSDCGTHNSPVYIQVISSIKRGGRLTTYNPGYPVNWGGGCAKTGNWVMAQAVNP